MRTKLNADILKLALQPPLVVIACCSFGFVSRFFSSLKIFSVNMLIDPALNIQIFRIPPTKHNAPMLDCKSH